MRAGYEIRPCPGKAAAAAAAAMFQASRVSIQCSAFPASSFCAGTHNHLRGYGSWLRQSGCSIGTVKKNLDEGATKRGCLACTYGDPYYWDERYADDMEPFEWYRSYAGFSPLVRRFIPLSSRLLMIGCGNSVMSEDMVKDGYEDITNIDISPVVIEAMQEKYHDIPQLKYMTMDARDLSFFNGGTFEAVIDKGMLDALMCRIDALYSAEIMFREISRVLKPGGVYMMITYGDPTVRMPYLDRNFFGWNVSLFIIPKPGSKKGSAGRPKAYFEVVFPNGDGMHANENPLEDMDSHFVYMCTKEQRV